MLNKTIDTKRGHLRVISKFSGFKNIKNMFKKNEQVLCLKIQRMLVPVIIKNNQLKLVN